MIRTRNAALALAAVMLAVGPALAAGTAENAEQTALLHSQLTLSQAIAAAEQRTGGKAYDAGVDAAHGKPRIVVETNGAGGVQTVTVDANSGRIISTHSGGQPD